MNTIFFTAIAPSIQRRNKIFGMALLLTVGVGVIILPTASATTWMSGENIASEETHSETSKTEDPNMAGMDHSSASTPTPVATEEMDPNMPGMDDSDSHSTPDSHSEPVTSQTQERPLKATLGIFGFGTISVLLSAVLLRRKDRKLALAKQMARAEKVGAKNE